MPVLNRICRESYTDPGHVYEVLKRRGMDLVTITDHDSIGAAESLRRNPDFFLSEEVSCTTPSGTKLHMGVYDIAEKQHIELERRRDDLPRLVAYLEENHLLFSINHVFSSLTGPRIESDFTLFADVFPAFETLNGQMQELCNVSAAALAARLGKIPVAGSDAHTTSALALTYTEVAGVGSKEDFFRGLRQGRSQVRGKSGSYWKLTADILEIGCEMLRANAWSRIAAPLLIMVPIITLGNVLRELAFVYKWQRHLELSLYDCSGLPEVESVAIQ